jgi:hypothetical protein
MCCGRNRTQRMGSPAIPKTRPATEAAVQKMPSSISFVYIGNTALTVKGPISGFEYRFDRPGARVEVDWRDRILLASIRQLRQIK